MLVQIGNVILLALLYLSIQYKIVQIQMVSQLVKKISIISRIKNKICSLFLYGRFSKNHDQFMKTMIFWVRM